MALGLEGISLHLLQNPFSVILLTLSVVLIFLVLFSTRIHGLRKRLHPIDIQCNTCNYKISRERVVNDKVVCPSCSEQLVRNNRKQMLLILAVVVLVLSLFVDKGLKYYFQITYILIMFIWVATKYFVKDNAKKT